MTIYENGERLKSDLSFDLLAEAMMIATSIHTDSDYAVFIDFSGHVEVLRVTIALDVERFNSKVFEVETYLKSNDEIQEIIDQLEAFYHDHITMKEGN